MSSTPQYPLQPQEVVNLLSMSMDLPVVYISYKWNHTIWGLLCLASFAQRNVFEAYPCCSLYYFLYLAKKHATVWIYHILFIHSVDKLLGGFHLLAIINNTAINICVQVFVWTCFHFLGYMPRSGVPGSNGTFKETARLFSKVATSMYIPSSNTEGSDFSTPSLTLAVTCLSDYSHPSGWVALPCISLITNGVEHLFKWFLGNCISFFGEMSLEIFPPFLIGLFVGVSLLKPFWTLAIFEKNLSFYFHIIYFSHLNVHKFSPHSFIQFADKTSYYRRKWSRDNKGIQKTEVCFRALEPRDHSASKWFWTRMCWGVTFSVPASLGHVPGNSELRIPSWCFPNLLTGWSLRYRPGPN